MRRRDGIDMVADHELLKPEIVRCGREQHGDRLRAARAAKTLLVDAEIERRHHDELHTSGTRGPSIF